MSFADANFIRPYLPFSDEEKESAKIEFEELVANGGGLSGAFRRILVSWPDSDKPLQRFIFKLAPEATLERNKNLGNAREAIFYEKLADSFRKANIPTARVIYTEGNMDTGVRSLVMDDLGVIGIQSGHLFGKGTPLNWQVDIAASVARLPTPRTAFEVAARSFVEAAKMHRLFWQDESVLNIPWLRGSDWVRGEGKESWETAQKTAVDYWKTTREKIDNGTCKVNWDSNLLECIEQALKNIDWDAYQEGLKSRPWTLVHGDFHPGNIMWIFADEEKEEDYPLMLDWEMVGLGSGPQEIAQYLISHMPPADRKRDEDALLHIYYNALVDPANAGNASLTAESYSYEDCKKQFAEGGAQRWIWFLPLLSSMCPDMMTQYFQDQVSAFLVDHDLTKDNIGCPRV